MLALPAAVAAMGLATASAASLGGITSSSYGADVGVVSSCDTDGVTVAFTNSYDASLGRYQTTAVTVSGIAAACAHSCCVSARSGCGVRRVLRGDVVVVFFSVVGATDRRADRGDASPG